MACSSCNKRKKTSQNTVALRSSTLSKINFIEVYYIGESNAYIPTSLPRLSYGSRKYGDKMIVAESDFNEYQGIWSYENPIVDS